MRSLREELRERADGVKSDVRLVARKVEDLEGDPVAERRARNKAIMVAAFAAIASGTVTLLIYLALGIHG